MPSANLVVGPSNAVSGRGSVFIQSKIFTRRLKTQACLGVSVIFPSWW
jgi:hypothetical protein